MTADQSDDVCLHCELSELIVEHVPDGCSLDEIAGSLLRIVHDIVCIAVEHGADGEEWIRSVDEGWKELVDEMRRTSFGKRTAH